MTNSQREIYMILLMAGREKEALKYREICNHKEN